MLHLRRQPWPQGNREVGPLELEPLRPLLAVGRDPNLHWAKGSSASFDLSQQVIAGGSGRAGGRWCGAGYRPGRGRAGGRPSPRSYPGGVRGGRRRGRGGTVGRRPGRRRGEGLRRPARPTAGRVRRRRRAGRAVRCRAAPAGSRAGGGGIPVAAAWSPPSTVWTRWRLICRPAATAAALPARAGSCRPSQSTATPMLAGRNGNVRWTSRDRATSKGPGAPHAGLVAAGCRRVVSSRGATTRSVSGCPRRPPLPTAACGQLLPGSAR